MITSSSKRRGVGFFSLCLAFFVIMLDTTLIPFLYPLLISDLGLKVSQAAAVNNLYLIAYAGTLLIGGKLGDTKDRKKVFLIGLLVLGAGSILGAFSNKYSLILIARFVMGLGAGLITPQSMAFISSMFESNARGLAFGIWGAVASVGTGLGPVVAKVATTVGFWEIAFWINVPMVLLSLVTAAIGLKAVHSGRTLSFQQISLPVIAGLSLMTFVYGVQLLSPDGRDIKVSVIMLVVTFIFGLVAIKLRINGLIAPLVNFNKVERSPYRAAVFASALLGGSLTAYYLPLSLSFSYVWKFEEMTIIYLMVFASVINAIFGVLAGTWSNKWGTKRLIISGLTIFSISCFLFAWLAIAEEIEKKFLIVMLIGVLALAEVGMGIAFGPLANSSMKVVHNEIVSEAAAFYNWVRQTFSAVGGVCIAFVTAAALQGADYSNPRAVGIASFAGFTTVSIALLMGAVISKGVKNA